MKKNNSEDEIKQQNLKLSKGMKKKLRKKKAKQQRRDSEEKHRKGQCINFICPSLLIEVNESAEPSHPPFCSIRMPGEFAVRFTEPPETTNSNEIKSSSTSLNVKFVNSNEVSSSISNWPVNVLVPNGGSFLFFT